MTASMKYTTVTVTRQSTSVEPEGTPVRAVVDGTIQKLFLSKAGGNTIYEFDEAGRVLLLLRPPGALCRWAS